MYVHPPDQSAVLTSRAEGRAGPGAKQNSVDIRPTNYARRTSIRLWYAQTKVFAKLPVSEPGDSVAGVRVSKERVSIKIGGPASETECCRRCSLSASSRAKAPCGLDFGATRGVFELAKAPLVGIRRTSIFSGRITL